VRRSLTPITREAQRESGEVIREFDVRSAATVVGAFLFALFLVFFLAAFLPWLLANGMTAAVNGLMHQVGFNSFSADTLGDWVLVLLMGAVFTAFITAIAVSILALYNLLSERTGMGMRALGELPAGDQPAIAEPVDPADEADDDFDALYAEAQRRGISGRSAMSKAELEAALTPKRRRKAAGATTRRPRVRSRRS
jgi:hypothetical protein